MSNYTQPTKHPETGEIEMADWLDDFFGPHRYGVLFPDGRVWREQDIEPEETTEQILSDLRKASGDGWAKGFPCDCGEERPSGLMSCHHPGCDACGCDACGEIEWSCDPDDDANGDYFCEEHR